MRPRIDEKLLRAVGLSGRDVRLSKQVAEPAHPDRGRGSVEQRGAEADRFGGTAVGDQRLELDQPGLDVVGAARRLRQEEVQRFARAAGDVLQRRK
jgi:hypothetical protein